MHMPVIHCRDNAAIKAAGDNYAYIGRPTKWGNPFSHKSNTMADTLVASREEAIKRYEEYLLNNDNLMNDLHELKGKVLGCWCAPKLCHGSILVKYANK